MIAASNAKKVSTDPIHAAQRLLDDYGMQLHRALKASELSDNDIAWIRAALLVDSGIYLSLNPLYKRSAELFPNFVARLRLPDALNDMFPAFQETSLYAHQEKGIQAILANRHTIITTGTGSGKTETFLFPIFACCLQSGEPGVKALIVYPMNALAGDQIGRIRRAVEKTGVSFGLYTGATPEDDREEAPCSSANERRTRKEIRERPPDILITNYVMLERMLTREADFPIFEQSTRTLRYVVLDELHSYTGSKAAHIKFLLARLNHRLSRKPVYIGTSATLSSNEVGKQKLREFITSLFDVDDFETIEAEEDWQEIDRNPFFPLDDAVLDRIDFSDESRVNASIKALTGVAVEASELVSVPADAIHTTATYRAVESSYVFNLIRDALRESACSLEDLVRAVSRQLPTGQSSDSNSDKLVRALLNAVAYINEKAGRGGKPLLDYRTHIFIRELGGQLQVCPNCGRYYPEVITHCERDGFQLFSAYRHDVRLFVGKFSGQTLSPAVRRESTDRNVVHYALIGRAEYITGDEFELRGDITPDGAFVRDENGNFRVAPLIVQSADHLDTFFISLHIDQQNYFYLQSIATTLLRTYRKLLGFVDNRELASRHSTVLNDEFASDFLLEFLRLYYPRGVSLDLKRTLDLLCKKAEGVQTSRLEQELFRELPLWFYRLIGVPERKGGHNALLRLLESAYEWTSLTEIQRELLDVFISERAINTGFADDYRDSRFIRLQKHWAAHAYGIYVGDTLSGDPRYRGISLGENAREYADFVRHWTPSAIQQAVDDLMEQDILISLDTPDGRTIYYLQPWYLCFDLEPSLYGEGDDGYERLKRERLFVADVHSSDRQAAARDQIEADFRSGNVQLVLATPTLEMGIDIGDLESVLMLGAPPTPANYAQRAGRAGRSSNRNALIATFCSSARAHDNHAFHNPRQMISGQVTPPGFDAHSVKILGKHVNAFALRAHLRNREVLRRFQAEAETLYNRQVPDMQRVFGDWFPYRDHLRTLQTEVAQVLNKAATVPDACYSEGIFPDYGFRQDEVIAIDIEQKDLLGQKPLDWKEHALTTRDPEQAFRFFLPGQIMFVAGEVYKTLNSGLYKTLDDGARQYHCFYAEKEVRFASRRREIRHFDMRQHFSAPVVALSDQGGVLALGYSRQCLLSFRNYGLRQAEDEANAEAERSQPIIGYDLEREAIILRFDSCVCDSGVQNSLVAALIWEINERYSLATGEVRLAGARLKDEQDQRWVYTLLYDYDGNNNLRLGRIQVDFNDIVHSAYQRLSACPCDTDGCYQCIRSYTTEAMGMIVSKAQAQMFLEYLLGLRPFEPAIQPFPARALRHDLVLSIRKQGQSFLVTSATGKRYQQPIEADENTTLFDALIQAINGEHRVGMRALRIETNEAWLANAINQRSLKKGREAFSRLQYALLKFDQVDAVVRKA